MLSFPAWSVGSEGKGFAALQECTTQISYEQEKLDRCPSFSENGFRQKVLIKYAYILLLKTGVSISVTISLPVNLNLTWVRLLQQHTIQPHHVQLNQT